MTLRAFVLAVISLTALQSTSAQVTSSSTSKTQSTSQKRVYDENSIQIPFQILSTFSVTQNFRQQSTARTTNVTREKICYEYSMLRNMMYGRSSGDRIVYQTYPVYPPRIEGDNATVYAQAVAAIDNLYEILSVQALNNDCRGTPNGKCCNKGGAAEKCNDKSGKYCEITGAISNCTTTSDNCG